MINDILSSKFYLVLKNGECIDSHLPDRVFYQDGLLKFENQELLEVQVVYILETQQEFQIDIRIAKHCQIQMIETKILAKDAVLHKNMYLDENAQVHIFSENQSDNSRSIENVYLAGYALCQYGFAELSDHHFEGVYHYYLDGEGADVKVRMAILSKQDEDKHYEVLIQHNRPHTYGQMDNYGVVKDQGRLIIDGIGTITKGQHGSASHQTNKIMVFDSSCVAGANPYLYIDDFDVKASHAAGVGKMDEEHLYYLQSRGLSKKQAMHLITYGYLKPVVEVIDNEMLKDRFEKALSKVGA
ncbi:SufD family Fe-S cluster assembly protein [Candidatus Stoquefichus massiliensis]|uniref:SufD family Fe-S cluster assembly protein n=1 Tax=Candidatus Stoquefichus massiliensis TaxID=1470350 RepID=UPI000489CA90|nr:SufD family Fe-S cluster assembly protein [Candidatus Stoquefichus massiliensis]